GGTWIPSDASEQVVGKSHICSYALAKVEGMDGQNPTIALSTTEFDSEATAILSMKQRSEDTGSEPVLGLADDAFLLKARPEGANHERISVRKTRTILTITCKKSCNDFTLTEKPGRSSNGWSKAIAISYCNIILGKEGAKRETILPIRTVVIGIAAH